MTSQGHRKVKVKKKRSVELSFIQLFICSFIQQIFAARHCMESWGYGGGIKDTHRLFLCRAWDSASVQISGSVVSLCDPMDCSTPASLSITNSWSLLKLMSIESVMPSSHLILCHPLLLPSSFPASGSFPMSQFFTSGGQSMGVSASASVLPMNIQDWSPLGWTGWISLQSKGLSRVFFNTTVQNINCLALSFLYSPALTSIHDHWKNHSFD